MESIIKDDSVSISFLSRQENLVARKIGYHASFAKKSSPLEKC